MLTKEVVKADRMDPRTKRTRELLLQAFMQLLMTKSFDTVTVQEIADQATVNRATFYAHFDDKYALLDYAFAESFKKALYSKVPPDSKFSPRNLQLLIQTVCGFLDELGTHCTSSIGTQFDSLVEQQAKVHLYEFLLGWLRQGKIVQSNRPNNAELRATVTSWAIYGTAVRWSHSDRKESVEEFAREALPLIMAGLVAPGKVATREKIKA
jgi:AcrR family transcriptional regulator